MIERRRTLGRALVILAAIGVVLATAAGAEARDHRGGGWRRGGSSHGSGGRVAVFHHHPHFHSFVFVGAGFGAAYPDYYPPYYAAPATLPPPVYVSKDDCYNTVPRSPGVADLYTCGGQYVGPISVP
jgi:hypothetical protein